MDFFYFYLQFVFIFYNYCMKILVKQIDLYKSVLNPKQYLPKYIVYLMYEDTPISAYIEYGDEKKQERIKDLNKQYQLKDNITNQYLIN